MADADGCHRLRWPRRRLVTALPASPLHGMAARDDRDWAVIRQWADELAPALG